MKHEEENLIFHAKKKVQKVDDKLIQAFWKLAISFYAYISLMIVMPLKIFIASMLGKKLKIKFFFIV